jgi:hypothetical protein
MQIGTVKDNQKAPIHRWFNHPAAGFSYRLVKSLVSHCEPEGKCLVLDPFVGCGTTAVEAKKNGVDCIGLEAHPLAWWIAKVKCFWEYDLNSLEAAMLLLQDTITRGHEWRRAEIDDYPDQVRKCFSDENLQKLTYIRQLIHNILEDERERDFFLLSLIGILRRASRISLGWSYIALDERHRKREKEAITLFLQQTNMMFADLVSVFKGPFARSGHADILLADAREFPPTIIPESVCLLSFAFLKQPLGWCLGAPGPSPLPLTPSPLPPSGRGEGELGGFCGGRQGRPPQNPLFIPPPQSKAMGRGVKGGGAQSPA